MRQRKKQKKSKKSSLRTIIAFCFIVLLLVFISLAIKTIFLIKNSTFTRNHQFTIAIVQGSRTAEVIALTPSTKSLSVLHVQTTEHSLPDLSYTLGVPFDGNIIVSPDLKLKDDIASEFVSLVRKNNKIKTNLTIIDLAQIALFVKTVDKDKIKTQTITLPKKNGEGDNVITALFTDPEIAQENVTVGIVNASGVSGVATKLERMLTNIGCNVVSVATSPSVESKSKIRYFGARSYTLTRVEKLLHLPVENLREKALSDIMIQLGTDNAPQQ